MNNVLFGLTLSCRTINCIHVQDRNSYYRTRVKSVYFINKCYRFNLQEAFSNNARFHFLWRKQNTIQLVLVLMFQCHAHANLICVIRNLTPWYPKATHFNIYTHVHDVTLYNFNIIPQPCILIALFCSTRSGFILTFILKTILHNLLKQLG